MEDAVGAVGDLEIDGEDALGVAAGEAALGVAAGALEAEEETVGVEATEEDGASVPEGPDVPDVLGCAAGYVIFFTTPSSPSVK